MKLEHVAFLGRRFGEYLDMFALREEDLVGIKVLDCPAGPSSFTAEARSRNIDSTACDILYGLSSEELNVMCRKDMERVFAKLDTDRDIYAWGAYYKDKPTLVQSREMALELFTEDFANHPGNYISAGLPELPFADGQFEMVLSGHFLFLYAQWITVEHHLDHLRELLRVSSSEVRVFPIVDLEANDYEYMGYILTALEDDGVVPAIETVPYEFQRGGNRMLRLRKNGGRCGL